MKAHVLVARLDNEGDVLLAGPAVRAVAAGSGSVTMLCGPRGEHAARLLPGVDEVVVFHAPWIDPEPEPVDRERALALADDLASRHIDQALVMTSFHQSPLPLALLLRFAGVPTIAATSVDYPGSLLDVRHRIEDDVHEVDRALSLAATMGYELPPADDCLLHVRIPDTAAVSLPPLPDRYVVVHPGASVPARAWGAEQNAALVETLAACGWEVVVTGGPAERALTSAVAGQPRAGVTDMGGRTSFAELAALLERADAIVVGNTGPAHLAAAVGTPVVSLYAPTVPEIRWRPWGVDHVLLGDQGIDCAGCRARECPFEHHPCIGGVRLDEVVAAVVALAGPVGRTAERLEGAGGRTRWLAA